MPSVFSLPDSFYLKNMPLVPAETEELKLADPPGGGPRVPEDDSRGGDGGGDDGSSRYIPGAGLLAMRLVLVSITALFVTIGIAYFARSRSPINWQHIAALRERMNWK